MSDARERVQRGIAFLDSHAGPGWREKLHPETLKSVSSNDCVATRVYPGGWVRASIDLQYDETARDLFQREGTASFGFNTNLEHGDDEAVVAAWKELA